MNSNKKTAKIIVPSTNPSPTVTTFGRRVRTKKERAIYQAAVERASHLDLTPIREMNFIDYNSLQKRPPQGNINLTQRVLLDVLQIGKDAAAKEGVELTGISLDFSPTGKIMARWEARHNGIIPSQNDYPSFDMELDFFCQEKGFEGRPSAFYESLVNNLSQKHLWSRGCPREFDITDFMVGRSASEESMPGSNPKIFWHPIFPAGIIFDELAVQSISTW